MIKKAQLLIILALSFTTLFGQVDVPTGNWRVHLPYANAFELTETPTDLLVIAEYGSFLLSKKDASIKRISKIDGFSEVQMSVAKYNYEKNKHPLIRSIHFLFDFHEQAASCAK